MAEQPFEQIPLVLTEPETPTLENFVPGPNGEALAALRRAGDGTGPQFIYIWGPEDCGKTHLLAALAGRNPCCVPDFEEGRRLYCVDDVDRLDAEGQERLFVLMNRVRAHPESRLVTSGSKHPAVASCRPDITSRLAWGLVFRIGYPGEEEVQAEFIRQAASRGIVITPEMASWVALHCPRGLGSLRRLLDRVDMYALEKKRRVTLPLIHQVLAAEIGVSAKEDGE